VINNYTVLDKYMNKKTSYIITLSLLVVLAIRTVFTDEELKEVNAKIIKIIAPN